MYVYIYIYIYIYIYKQIRAGGRWGVPEDPPSAGTGAQFCPH